MRSARPPSPPSRPSTALPPAHGQGGPALVRPSTASPAGRPVRPRRGLAVRTRLHSPPLQRRSSPRFELSPAYVEPPRADRSAIEAAVLRSAESCPRLAQHRALDKWTGLLEASGGQPAPRVAGLLCERAAALLRLGRLDEALEDVDRALRHQPASFEALVLRGDLLGRLAAEPVRVLAAYSAALRLAPQSGRVLARFAAAAQRADGHMIARRDGWPAAQRAPASGPPSPGSPAAGRPGRPPGPSAGPDGAAEVSLPLSLYTAAASGAPTRPVFRICLRPRRGSPDLGLGRLALEGWGPADALCLLPSTGGTGADGADGAEGGGSGGAARPLSAAAGPRSVALNAAPARLGAGPEAASHRAVGCELRLAKLEAADGAMLCVILSLAHGGQVEVLSNSAPRAEALARSLLLEQPPAFRSPADFEVHCFGWLPADADASQRFCAALAEASARGERASSHKARRPADEFDAEPEPPDETARAAEDLRELSRWLAELGLAESLAQKLAHRGVSLRAPLDLADEELLALGVREPSDRLRIAEGHAGRLLASQLRAQLERAERRAEALSLRLSDARATASAEAYAARVAEAALAGASAALAMEQAEANALRRRGRELEAKAANEDARQRELRARVSAFAGDAGELVHSTAELKEAVHTAFREQRAQMEGRALRTISRFTGRE